MKTTLPAVDWPHRAEVGKFCMFNCFQESLAPVLKRDFGIDGDTFDRLRFIGLTDIADPIIGRRDPGGFGGMGWPRLRELYRLRWRWLRKVARNRPETVHALAQDGPLIAVVDRFHVPTDKVCFRKYHRMHTILIVRSDEDGVGYTDVEYPFNPARVSWEDLGRALLPAEDRKLLPGPDQVNSFVVRVEECTDPGPAERDRIRRDFLAAFAGSLDADASQVKEVRELVMDGLTEAGRDGDELRGNDLGSLLNGAVRSLQVAAGLLDPGTDAGVYATGLWKQGDAANRLLQMYVESGRDRYLTRIDRELERLVERWDAADRQAVQDAVRERASVPAAA
jgi:hypothetical protein